MRSAVFRPRTRNGPNGTGDLAPAHPSDFVSSLAGKDRTLRKRADRIAKPLGGLPDECQFLVAEHAVATYFRCGALHANGGRDLNERALDAPRKHVAERRQWAVCSYKPASTEEAIEQSDDLTPINVLNPPTAKGG